MPAPPPLKVLVCGSFDTDNAPSMARASKRVAAVCSSSGPFDCMFTHSTCTGGAMDTLLGGIGVDTYVLGPPSGCETSRHVTVLGRSGRLVTSGGLTVVYATRDLEPTSLDDLATATSACAQSVDVLLMDAWPHGVTKYAATPDFVATLTCSDVHCSQLLFRLRPRYVFCLNTGQHYERLPYRNHAVLQDRAANVTRFVALAHAGNAHKAKWMYAFNILPAHLMSRADVVHQPPDTTECPFSAAQLSEWLDAQKSQKKREPDMNPYFFSLTTKSAKRPARTSGQIEDCHTRECRKRSQACWFCLSSADVEKHLVVHINEACYLALAKGPLVPDHVLILPVEHVPSQAGCSDELAAEIADYQRNLSLFFGRRNKRVVFYERNFRQNHLQIQCVPLPAELCQRAQLLEAVENYFESEGLFLQRLPEDANIRDVVGDSLYFYIQLPHGDRLWMNLAANVKISLNIGRAALASPQLLNLGAKVNWSDCKMSHEEECELAENFRNSYNLMFPSDDDC